MTGVATEPGGAIVVRLLRPALAPVVREVLGDRFDPSEIRAVLDEAFRGYDRARSEIPREDQMGPRLMVHLAALTAGFYRSLCAHGVSEPEARRLTGEVTWAVYEKMAEVPWALAGIGSRDPYERLETATDLFRRFPFSAPGYEMVDVAAEPDVVAFDVRRCPVAEYLRGEGLAELCVETWCSLDVGVAKIWGARLERPLTLAQGADRCDFRWRLVPDDEPEGDEP